MASLGNSGRFPEFAMGAIQILILARTEAERMMLVVEFTSEQSFISYPLRHCEAEELRLAEASGFHGTVSQTDTFISNPRHPYTRLLISSVPMPDPRQRWRTDV